MPEGRHFYPFSARRGSARRGRRITFSPMTTMVSPSVMPTEKDRRKPVRCCLCERHQDGSEVHRDRQKPLWFRLRTISGGKGRQRAGNPEAHFCAKRTRDRRPGRRWGLYRRPQRGVLPPAGVRGHPGKPAAGCGNGLDLLRWPLHIRTAVGPFKHNRPACHRFEHPHRWHRRYERAWLHCEDG